MKNLKMTFMSSITPITLASSLAICLTLGLLGTSKWYQKDAVKQMSLSSGVSTCFQRVSQTFTALMISDFNSPYLSKPFMNTTSDCFSYAAKTFDEAFKQSFKKGSRSITAMNSDIHWFHEKASKLVKMSRDSGLDLSNSNIINKYSSLEELKSSFQEGIESNVESSNQTSNIFFGASLVTFVIGFLLIGFNLFKRAKRRELFERIEVESVKAMELNSEFVSANIERAVDNVFNKVNMPNTYSLFNKYHADLLERAYRTFEGEEGIDIEAVREIPKAHGPTSFYQEAINNALDTLSEKAFSHGIILETQLEDDFYVKGESEALEQTLCNILNYSADKCLTQDESRKLDIKSKALGGTAYLKIKIENYCFNADELDYMSGNIELESSVDLNLILVQEMLKDLNATISLRNLIHSTQAGCEIEVLFDRVKVDKATEQTPENSKRVSSVVKGSKKEILRAMGQNA